MVRKKDNFDDYLLHDYAVMAKRIQTQNGFITALLYKL
jgi:hypothetical protein